jgi:radical SAM superfamily enzyme YgiQ (UPF0313 family)
MCPYYLYQGKKWRARSPKSVIDELQYLKKRFNAKNIQLRDPNFTLNLKRIKDICQLVIDANLHLDLRVETDLERLDRKFLEMLKDAGLTRIMTGIESPDSTLLAEIGQKINPLDKIMENIEICHSLGIGVLVFYMFGFPSQRWEHVVNIVRLNKQIKADTSTTILTPYPGTKFWEDIKNKGLLLKEPEYHDLTGKKCIVRSQYLSGKEIELARAFSQMMFYLQKKRRLLVNYKRFDRIYHTLRLFGSYFKGSRLVLKVYKRYWLEKYRMRNQFDER